MIKLCVFIILLFVFYVKSQPSLSCEFTGIEGRDIHGIVTLSEEGQKVQLGGFLFSQNKDVLVAGPHGFHIHEKGDIKTNTSTGGHFNPFNGSHGCGSSRHAGDIGNIVVRYQNGYMIADASLLNTTLIKVSNVVGLALVLHEKEDNCSASFGAKFAHCVLGIKKSSYLVTKYVGKEVSKATCFFQPSSSTPIQGKVDLVQGEKLSLNGSIEGNNFTGSISLHIIEHGEMSQSDMSDCSDSIYSFNASSDSEAFTFELPERTLHSSENSNTCLIGKQLCLVNNGEIIAQCVIGVLESKGDFPTTTTTTGSHSHDDNNVTFSKAGMILGIVLAVFVLLGLAAYTFLQRRRRMQRGFQRVVNS